MIPMPRRRLGSSGLEVSRLALGSWRTYDRVPREVGVAIMRKAQGCGINFLDDARYNDETGTAPMKTGYSEVVFGELFRAAAWKRNEVVVANKLWWEFWPRESAEAELDGSLGRMGMDYLDIAYAEVPPAGLGLDQLVAGMAELIAKGKLRAWGVLNWPPALIAEAARVAAGQGAPSPCVAQLAYSVARRSPVEDADMVEVLRTTGTSVIASFVLSGGALTDKYSRPEAKGRMAGRLDDPRQQGALVVAPALRRLAEQSGTTPAALAIAFALLNPTVASVLFGATSPEQIVENVEALGLPATMSDSAVAELVRIGT